MRQGGKRETGIGAEDVKGFACIASICPHDSSCLHAVIRKVLRGFTPNTVESMVLLKKFPQRAEGTDTDMS